MKTNGTAFKPGLRTAFTALVLTLAVVWGCGGGGGPAAPIVLDTPEAYTARGWERFEAGNFSDALADFDAALGLAAQHGPALTGRAWVLLVQATSQARMQEALAVFAAAIAAGEDGGDALAGKACARLGAGDRPAAASDAAAALAAAPGFVFAHRTSFNSTDLLLIVAVAKATDGDFAGALAAADLIAASGIDAGTSATWVVGGVTYPTFAGAVLARLQTLSDAHAG